MTKKSIRFDNSKVEFSICTKKTLVRYGPKRNKFPAVGNKNVFNSVYLSLKSHILWVTLYMIFINLKKI